MAKYNNSIVVANFTIAKGLRHNQNGYLILLHTRVLYPLIKMKNGIRKSANKVPQYSCISC